MTQAMAVANNGCRWGVFSDTGGPVHVSVNIYLRSISKIDDVNMEYSSQFTFREEWWDARLAYGRLADDDTEVPPFVVLATAEMADTSQQIWMPDTFVSLSYTTHHTQ